MCKKLYGKYKESYIDIYLVAFYCLNRYKSEPGGSIVTSEIPDSVTRECHSESCGGAQRTFNRQFVIKTGPDVHVNPNPVYGPAPKPEEWTFHPSGPRLGAPLSTGACATCGNVATIPPTKEELQEMGEAERASFEKRKQEAISKQYSRMTRSLENDPLLKTLKKR